MHVSISPRKTQGMMRGCTWVEPVATSKPFDSTTFHIKENSTLKVVEPKCLMYTLGRTLHVLMINTRYILGFCQQWLDFITTHKGVKIMLECCIKFCTVEVTTQTSLGKILILPSIPPLVTYGPARCVFMKDSFCLSNEH